MLARGLRKMEGRMSDVGGAVLLHTIVADAYKRGLAAGIAQERERCARVLEALKPFADRGRATFTTGDYDNPEPAPDKQIFGSEVLLSVGDLRRAREAYDAAIRAGEASE